MRLAATTEIAREDVSHRPPKLLPPVLGFLPTLSLAAAAAGLPQDEGILRPADREVPDSCWPAGAADGTNLRQAAGMFTSPAGGL